MHMIKTITETDPLEFDAAVNEFERSHQVYATQTHILRNEGMSNLYVAVIYYRTALYATKG